MEARDDHTDFTIQDFESKAQELIHIMLAICEKRLWTAGNQNDPMGTIAGGSGAGRQGEHKDVCLC